MYLAEAKFNPAVRARNPILAFDPRFPINSKFLKFLFLHAGIWIVF